MAHAGASLILACPIMWCPSFGMTYLLDRRQALWLASVRARLIGAAGTEMVSRGWSATGSPPADTGQSSSSRSQLSGSGALGTGPAGQELSVLWRSWPLELRLKR